MKGRENWGALRRWWALQWFKLVRITKKVMRSNSSAHSIAFGASIGFFVGLLPIMGIQMIVSAVLATFLRASRIAAVLPVWITNPATAIPIYAFNYWVGYLVTGWGPSQEQFKIALVNSERIVAEQGLLNGIADGFHELLHFGPQAFFSLMLGSTVVGLIAALVVYMPVLYLVKRVRAIRAHRRQQRHDRVTRHLSTLLHAPKKTDDPDGAPPEAE